MCRLSNPDRYTCRAAWSGLGIRVFSGLECDIKRDGSMDLTDDALVELDVVVASVHSYMNMESAEMTESPVTRNGVQAR